MTKTTACDINCRYVPGSSRVAHSDACEAKRGRGTNRPALHMSKEQTAAWLGYGDDVAAMDASHDKLHASLCAWIGRPSLSLRDAQGVPLSDAERTLAAIEEDAVLHVQRFLRHWRTMEPGI